MEEIFQYFIEAITDNEVNTIGTIFKLCLSMLLGSLVGYERKRKGQVAGVRTFSLISMGATLAMILSIYIPQEYLGLKNGDPGRIAAQIITGIGFLGAGAIIQMKGSVRGLTTAAGIWMVATIGMTIGVGLYLVAFVATGLIFFILVELVKLEQHISKGVDSRIIRLRVGCIIRDLESYKSILATHKIPLQNLYLEYDYDRKETSLDLIVLLKEGTDYVNLFQELQNINPTKSISLATQLSH